MTPQAPPLRIAVAQLRLVDGDRDANLGRVLEVIAAHGPTHDILLLPETCTSGFASLEDVARLAEPLDGLTVRTLQSAARRHDLLVVAGIAERAPEGLYNTAVLVDGDGLRGAYRKTHLWLDDRGMFLPGDDFVALPWRGTRLAPLICFDLEFPETARAVAALGAELALACNGNMEPYAPVHRLATAARALENQMFVAVANRTGPGRRMNFAGGSLVAGPDGCVLAEAGTEETVLSVALQMGDVASARAAYDYLTLRRVGLTLDAAGEGGSAARIPGRSRVGQP